MNEAMIMLTEENLRGRFMGKAADAFDHFELRINAGILLNAISRLEEFAAQSTNVEDQQAYYDLANHTITAMEFALRDKFEAGR